MVSSERVLESDSLIPVARSNSRTPGGLPFSAANLRISPDVSRGLTRDVGADRWKVDKTLKMLHHVYRVTVGRKAPTLDEFRKMDDYRAAVEGLRAVTGGPSGEDWPVWLDPRRELREELLERLLRRHDEREAAAAKPADGPAGVQVQQPQNGGKQEKKPDPPQ